MFAGLFLVSYGFQFTHLSSVLLAGLLGVSYFSVIIGEATLDFDSSSTSMWIVFFASVGVGVIYMNLTYSRFYMGCFNFGFSFGTVLSLILNCVILFKLELTPIYLPLVLSILILGIFFGLLGCRFLNSVGILSTSFVGAYLVIKPITWFTGKYQNELLLNKMQLYAFPIEVDWVFYVYIASIALITMVGVWFQY